MASKSERILVNYDDFDPIKAGGKFQGLGNLMRTEISRWRHSLAWWLQIVAVILFCNGITIMAMLGTDVGKKELGLMMFPMMSGFYVALSAMTMIQGAIVKEKVEGTAAWVLSKPVTRVAFMTSKFITNCISMTIALVFLPWIVAYLQFFIVGGINLIGTFLAMGIFWTYCMFWLTMALMLGSIFNSRRPIMTIMFTVFFLFIATGSFPIPKEISPLFFWPGSGITNNPEFPQSIISNVLQGTYYVNLGPLIFGICCILFLTIAYMQFSKVEL